MARKDDSSVPYQVYIKWEAPCYAIVTSETNHKHSSNIYSYKEVIHIQDRIWGVFKELSQLPYPLDNPNPWVS
jgi:hypothetical protein